MSNKSVQNKKKSVQLNEKRGESNLKSNLKMTDK